MTDLEVRVPGGMELLASLERLGAATSISLELPYDLSYERYEALGVALGRAQRTVAWMIGDWINFGEKAYGEKYTQAVGATNMTPETLMNYASISRKVPRERRRAELPFSVHALVAPMDPGDQEMWLAEAVEKKYSRADLRDRLRGKPPAPLPSPPQATLEECCRWLIDSAQAMGDGYLVRGAAFEQLCAVMGES